MSGDSEHRTIGIVLAGNLGDVLLWSAVIKPLKERFENSRIILIGSAATLELLRTSPVIDEFVLASEIHLWPWGHHRIPGKRLIGKWRRKLKSARFSVDLLIFPTHVVGQAEADLLEAVECKASYGIIHGLYLGVRRTEWDLRLTQGHSIATRTHDERHILKDVQSFLEWLGCREEYEPQPHLRIDRARSKKISDETGLTRGIPFGILFPGCRYLPRIKTWSAENWSIAFRDLQGILPQHWLILAHAAEMDFCRTVERAIGKSAPEFKTLVYSARDLSTLADVVDGAQIAMGIDNGGMHLSVAMNIPSVTILSGAMGHRYFPWGPPDRHRVVSHPMDCWHCNYNCIHERPLCVESISTQQVVETTQSLLRNLSIPGADIKAVD